jgi:hypothetical protein
MTKTANKFNSLAQIAFVEDIDQETAANYSGGRSDAMIFYTDANLQGGSLTVNSSPPGTGIGYVGDSFNDKFSSFQINEGQWEFYSDAEYQGNVIYVGPGTYNQVALSFNDKISSFKRVG